MSQPGECIVSRMPGSVLVMSLSGYFDADTVERMNESLKREQQQGRWRAVLCDTTAMSGFAASVRTGASKSFQLMKDSGAEMFVLVVKMPGIKMMASALGFGIGLPIRAVSSREEGLAVINALPKA